MSDVRETSAIRPTTVARWRIALISLGLLLLLVGAITLLNDVNPKRYIGIATWFLGALIIHDGIIAFVIVGINVVMRRVGRRVPLPVLLILQGAIVVGAIMALIVFPEIMKQAIGTGNATLLPLDYAGNLAIFYAALAIATAAIIGIYLRMAARRRTKA